ncbi:unnamed protein product [Nezara viridula]|uniref:Peptidase S1 domain-containing protein n=1 Tax=Nezara viridula TaxID=85310 RepID=A0A9P0HF71_NEZVI|nr:unnamed protein product [Nezara viridula]
MKVLLICLMLVCLSWANSTGSVRIHSSCNCGWRNTARIVGGKSTRKNEYPWMASLNGCGGSIITKWHILTAAHCTDRISASRMTVNVGLHYIFFGPNENMEKHRVARTIQHENYDNNGDKPLNDIAVLVLATPIKFNRYVGPICLPNSQLDILGKLVKVIGWGMTKGTGDGNVLNEVDVEVISRSECERSWPLSKIPNQLCAFALKKDSCNGDSGGPLVYHLDPVIDRFVQVALVSYGPPACGSDPRPSVNTDIFAFSSWIQKAIAESIPEVSICITP